MKIFIVVKSQLLAHALHAYLRDFVSDFKTCDFVICDEDFSPPDPKPLCKICDFTAKRSQISRPLSRDSLFADVKKFYENLHFDERLKKISQDPNGAFWAIKKGAKNIRNKALKARVQQMIADFESEK